MERAAFAAVPDHFSVGPTSASTQRQGQPMQSSRISVMLVAAVLGAGLVSAQQSLLVSQGQVISFSAVAGTPDGDLAPGLSMGERFGGYFGPNSGPIDDAGRV